MVKNFRSTFRSAIRRWFFRFGIISILAVFTVAFQNCSGGFQSASELTAAHLSSSAGGGGASSGPSPILMVEQPAAQTSVLGKSFTVPVSISSSGGYSGTVNLSVTEPELTMLDPGQGIKFSIAPSNVTLSDKSPTTATVTVNVTTMAPSFNASMFHIVATDAKTSSLTTSTAVALQVQAIYNVDIKGPAAAPENWGLPIGPNTSFIAHSEGLVVNFRNLDPTTPHIIHSTDGFSVGPIIHESLTVPYPGTSIIGLPPASALGSVGGVYSQTVAADTTASSTQVWDHVNEGASQARTMVFNAPVPTGGPAPTPSPTPSGATFSAINSTIFQTSCVGCHSGSTPAGNTNLTTYAGVLTVVSKGNATGSTLYNEVASGDMPKGGTRLSAQQVLNIAAWINAGAPQN